MPPTQRALQQIRRPRRIRAVVLMLLATTVSLVGCVVGLAILPLTAVTSYGGLCYAQENCPIWEQFTAYFDSGGAIRRLADEENYVGLDPATTNLNRLSGLGDLVVADEISGLRVEGNLRDCLVQPEPALIEPESREEKERNRSTMFLDLRTFEKFERPTRRGPSVNSLRGVHIRFDKVVREQIDGNTVLEALRRDFVFFSITCRRWILQPNIYVVTDVLKLEGLQYQFVDVKLQNVNFQDTPVASFYEFASDVVKDDESPVRLRRNGGIYVGLFEALPITSNLNSNPEPIQDVLLRYNLGTAAGGSRELVPSG